MSTETLTVEAGIYHCVSCSLERNEPVYGLVRMIPRSVVIFGALTGPELWCCAVCHEAKFDLKRRPVKLPKMPTNAEVDAQDAATAAEAKKKRQARLRVV